MLLALPSCAVERSCNLQHLAIFRLVGSLSLHAIAPNPNLRFQRLPNGQFDHSLSLLGLGCTDAYNIRVRVYTGVHTCPR